MMATDGNTAQEKVKRSYKGALSDDKNHIPNLPSQGP